MSTQMTCLVFLSDLQVDDLMSQILIFLGSGKHTLKTGQNTPIFSNQSSPVEQRWTVPIFIFPEDWGKVNCQQKCTASFRLLLYIP